jgi:hypothetical protein
MGTDQSKKQAFVVVPQKPVVYSMNQFLRALPPSDEFTTVADALVKDDSRALVCTLPQLVSRLGSRHDVYFRTVL